MIAKIEEFDDKWHATLEGEMDTAAALEAQKVLKPLYNGGGKNVLIECGKLEYIASSGLRILLGILKSAIATGSTVTLPLFFMAGYAALILPVAAKEDYPYLCLIPE